MTQEQHAQPRACAAQPSRCRSLGTHARREHAAAVVRALPPAAACSRWAACCVLTPTSVHDAVSFLADKGVATTAAPAPPAPGGSNAPRGAPTGSGEASSACAHAALLRPLAAHSEVVAMVPAGVGQQQGYAVGAAVYDNNHKASRGWGTIKAAAAADPADGTAPDPADGLPRQAAGAVGADLTEL